MIMTREDVLRELELLPVWKLNPVQVVNQPQPVIEAQAVEAIVASATATVAKLPEPVLVSSMTVLEALAVQPPVEPPLQKIAVPWLLYCPLPEANTESANTDALTLLKNMINAMQLLSTDYQLVQDEDTLSRYQAPRVLLFGLAAANTFLKAQAAEIEELGTQPLVHAQSHCWVIDHPLDLLQTPMRKRLAWQVMCAAIAHAKQEDVQ